MYIVSVELTTKKWPVIYAAPPPPDSCFKHAKQTFMDGIHDYLSEPRLVNHAATCVKCCPVAPSNSNKAAGSSRGGTAPKLKCEVVVSHPSQRWTAKWLGQVIDLCSDDEQSIETGSKSDSDYYPAANSSDNTKINVDKAPASLPKATSSSSSEEFTLLGHPKKWKASSPQLSCPALSKCIKGSGYSQRVASLKGKEPARTYQIKGCGRHVHILSPINISSSDEQCSPSLSKAPGPETLFNDSALEDTRNEAHSDAHHEAHNSILKDIHQSILPHSPVNVPVPVNTSTPVNTSAPVNTSDTDGFQRPPSIHVTQQPLDAPSQGASGLSPPEPHHPTMCPRPHVMQQRDTLNITNTAFLQVSPATSELTSTEGGQVISAASASLIATEEGRGSISAISHEGLAGLEAANKVPSQLLRPLEGATSYNPHTYSHHLHGPGVASALQFQDDIYLPDGYAPMSFNNVGWYNSWSSAENCWGPHVPMYALPTPTPPPPYHDAYHQDMLRYGPHPPLQYHEMGPGYYYPAQECPYQGYHDSAPHHLVHLHFQPPLPGGIQMGRNAMLDSEQNHDHGEGLSQQRWLPSK